MQLPISNWVLWKYREPVIKISVQYWTYGLDGMGFGSRQGHNIFLSCKSSGPALGPSQPPVQREPDLFSAFKPAGAWCWLTSHLVARLRMSGATPLLPHLPSCGAHSHLWFYMILHRRAPLDKTRTERIDGLHRRGSEREFPVFETGRKWCGCRAVYKFSVLVIW